MKSTSSFLVSKLRAEGLLVSLIVRRVYQKGKIKDGRNRLRSTSAFFVYNDVSLKIRFKFFFPLGNSSLCNCKRESDQNPEQTQPKLLPQRR